MTTQSYPQGVSRSYVSKHRPELVAELLTPTERQKREIIIRQVNAGETELTIKWTSATAACSQLCKSITPHEHRGKQITTGAELAEFGDSHLVWEIGRELLDELSLTPEKKLFQDTYRVISSGDACLQWDCNRCIAQGRDRFRGCRPGQDADPRFVHFIVGVGRFRKCPKAWLKYDVKRFERMIADVIFWRTYGVLPNAGGMLDQDPLFLEAITLIEDEIKFAAMIQEARRQARERGDDNGREQPA